MVKNSNDPDDPKSRSRDDLCVLATSARWLAESAKRSGLSVIAYDEFGDFDLARVCQTILPFQSVNDAQHWIKTNRQQGDFLIGSGLETHWNVYRSLASLPGWKNTSRESIELARDTLHWSEVLSQRGFFTAEVGLLEFVLSNPSVNWIRKSKNSTGGQGVGWLNSRKRRLEHSSVFQKFVPGQPMSSLHLGVGGQSKTLGLFIQLVGKPRRSIGEECGFWADHQWVKPFQFAGAMGPLSSHHVDREGISVRQVHEIADAIVLATGLQGAFGIDWVYQRGKGLVPIEINPRFTATSELWELATGANAVGAHLDALEGKGVVEPAHNFTLAKAFLFRQGSDFVVGESLHQQLLRFWERGVVADVPRVGKRIGKAEPIVTVYSSRFENSKEMSDVWRSLKEHMRQVHDLISESD